MRELRCLNGHRLDYANQLCNICLERIKMPSASDESREEMRKMFGNSISEAEPLKYLMDKGYTEKQNGMLRPPPRHIPTNEEWACIEFLCDEWDFAYDPLSKD